MKIKEWEEEVLSKYNYKKGKNLLDLQGKTYENKRTYLLLIFKIF